MAESAFSTFARVDEGNGEKQGVFSAPAVMQSDSQFKLFAVSRSRGTCLAPAALPTVSSTNQPFSGFNSVVVTPTASTAIPPTVFKEPAQVDKTGWAAFGALSKAIASLNNRKDTPLESTSEAQQQPPSRSRLPNESFSAKMNPFVMQCDHHRRNIIYLLVKQRQGLCEDGGWVEKCEQKDKFFCPACRGYLCKPCHKAKNNTWHSQRTGLDHRSRRRRSSPTLRFLCRVFYSYHLRKTLVHQFSGGKPSRTGAVSIPKLPGPTLAWPPRETRRGYRLKNLEGRMCLVCGWWTEGEEVGTP